MPDGGIYTWENAILVSNGGIAADEECCCGDNACCYGLFKLRGFTASGYPELDLDWLATGGHSSDQRCFRVEAGADFGYKDPDNDALNFYQCWDGSYGFGGDLQICMDWVSGNSYKASVWVKSISGGIDNMAYQDTEEVEEITFGGIIHPAHHLFTLPYFEGFWFDPKPASITLEYFPCYGVEHLRDDNDWDSTPDTYTITLQNFSGNCADNGVAIQVTRSGNTWTGTGGSNCNINATIEPDWNACDGDLYPDTCNQFRVLLQLTNCPGGGSGTYQQNIGVHVPDSNTGLVQPPTGTFTVVETSDSGCPDCGEVVISRP